jgi:hypothetical protein
MLSFVNAILGGALLLAGRKLFWLFVGVIGFIIGVEIATRFFHGSELTTLIAGLALGVLFAVLAIFVETLAIGVAGFLGGGYILLSLAGLFGLDKGIVAWVVFIVGGIIGVVLIASLFDWALIIISSLAGSSMILNAFHFAKLVAAVAFIVLVIIGIVVQASALSTGKHGERGHA